MCPCVQALFLYSSENVGDIDDDDVSSESDIEEELGFISPSDNVDPYASFKHALTSKFEIFPRGKLLMIPP